MSSVADKQAASEVVMLDESLQVSNKNDSVSNLSDSVIIMDESSSQENSIDLSNSNINDTSSNFNTSNNDGNADPILKVIFRDLSLFKNYHEKIEKFLIELISQEFDKKIIKSYTRKLTINILDSNNWNNSSDVYSEEKQSNNLINSVAQEQLSNDILFTIDTELKLQDDLDIPMYGKKFNKALQKTNVDTVEVKNSAPKKTCFNCLGNHSLRDCDKPRNYAAINKNRKDYNAKRGPTNNRYHLEDDQKFGHLTPGQISHNLRKALGVKENELPRHIYRMRVLGYPPGWLEEARLQHSGLTLFDSDGLAEEGSDEGEISIPEDKDQYDIKKIIDFPGFNVSPPHGTRDEQKQYWGSMTQVHYSKTTMLSYLSHKKVEDGYKRKKLPNPANTRIRTDVNAGEMDLDEIEDTSVECVPVKDLFIPPLPKEDIPEPPPPPPPPLQTQRTEDSDNQSQEDISMNSNDESTAPSSRADSPTLFDLECAKKKLLAELDESSSQSNPDITKTGVPELDFSKTEESKLNKQDVNSVTPKNRKSVKVIHLGTPLLHSNSPYRRLPASEKFSKDICDVINFENLPDSTGKYDQMSELLQKVRKVVTEIQKE